MDFAKYFEVELNGLLESHPHILTDVTAVYQFEMDDAGCWHLDLESGTKERKILPGQHQQPDCTIRMNSSDFKRLVTGELGIARALLFGKIKIEGEKSLALQLQELFS